MLWAISRIAAPNFAAMREKGLQAHLDYLHSQKKILVVSGATLTDDGKEIVGSLLIVNVNSRAEAKAFADVDPFQKGLKGPGSIKAIKGARLDFPARAAAC